jgi:flagellar hook-length control protein FliK
MRRTDLADARPSPSAQDPLPSGRPAATTGKAPAPIGSESPAFGDAAAQRPGFGTAANELPMPARPADAEAAALPVQNAAPLHHLPAMAGAAPPGGAPAPVGEYAVTMPVHSPQFAEALGVQVSVLARGGIERAELQLNPASMGPLSVQITLDAGQAQAQVFFGSDSAQTRQAVEAGMPALAAALRDAGFTLSGGGVSQHPGDPRQHGAGARGTTNFGLRLPAAPDEELRPLRSARAAPGRLDLYA